MTELRCDMKRECPAPVAMIDGRGFAYCADHGMQRQAGERCRKLRPWELARLQRGETISY